MARQGKDADEHGDRPRAAKPSQEPIQVLRIEDDLRHREPCTGLELLPKTIELDLHVVRRRIDGDAGEERRRRIDRAAVEVLAAVEVRHQPGQADRVDLVDAARSRVVTDLGWIAGDREHVAHAFGVRSEQHGL